MILALVCILTDARIGHNKPPTSAPIIDGTYAGEYEFPYIVAIRQEGSKIHGAGVIIDPQWIITARHIVMNVFTDTESAYFNFSNSKQLYVYPKYDNNISQFYKWPYYVAEKLFCAHIPSDYNIYPTDADLALIKLSQPIPLGNKSPYNLQKIKIYACDMSYDFRSGYDIRVAGWGKAHPNQRTISDYLRKAEIPNESRLRYTREDQLDLRAEAFYRHWQQIALYFPNHAICHGDSGGPAVVTTVGTGEEYLFGIISWVSATEPICQYLGFVINLAAYSNWIYEVMRNEEVTYGIYNCAFLHGLEYNAPMS